MALPAAHTPNPALLVIEFGLTAVMAGAAFAWPRLGAGLFQRLERLFLRLARRPMWAVAAVGLSVILLRLAIYPLFPTPIPFVPDDFSFMLACNTFVQGRLANPTPAMWRHFETIHVSMRPTYQSMYFPGQGLVMAASTLIFGHPWVGLLLVSALMCAALCWALQAWLPPGWALLGGMIAVLRLGVFSYWTNTYHAAGSLAALGGALVLGGLPRLTRTGKLRYAMLMGIGISILALTRPYEGVLLCLPVGFALGRWIWKGKNRPSAGRAAQLIAAPLAVILATCAWLGYYDYRAFGNPLTPPYTVNRAQYAIAPYYVWQQPRPEPKYRFPEMREFYYVGELDFYKGIHSITGYLPHSLAKVGFLFLFYSCFALFAPMFIVHRVFRDRRTRFLLISVLILAAGMAIEIYMLPHYVAPFTVAFYAIGLQAMRHLRLWKAEGKPVGMALVRMCVTVCVVMAGIRIFAEPLHLAPPEWAPGNWNFTWFGPQHFGVERQQIEAQLGQEPGGSLIFVRYWPGHYPLDEWVYNQPDIDHAKVVWARDMGPADNLELIRYYSHRKVWLVEPDAIPARVWPYSVQGTAAGK